METINELADRIRIKYPKQLVRVDSPTLICRYSVRRQRYGPRDAQGTMTKVRIKYILEAKYSTASLGAPIV